MTKGIILKEMDNIEVVYCKHCKKIAIYKKEEPNEYINCFHCDYLLELRPRYNKNVFWLSTYIWEFIAIFLLIDSSPQKNSPLVIILSIFLFGFSMGGITYLIYKMISFINSYIKNKPIEEIKNILFVIDNVLDAHHSRNDNENNTIKKIISKTIYNNYQYMDMDSKIYFSPDIIENLKVSTDTSNVEIDNNEDTIKNNGYTVNKISESIHANDDINNEKNDELFQKLQHIMETVETEPISHNNENLYTQDYTKENKIDLLVELVNEISNHIIKNTLAMKMINNFIIKKVFADGHYSLMKMISIQNEIKNNLWVTDYYLDDCPKITDNLPTIDDSLFDEYNDFYELFIEEFGEDLYSIIQQSSLKANDFHINDEEKFQSNIIEYPMTMVLLSASIDIMSETFQNKFQSMMSLEQSPNNILEELIKVSLNDRTLMINEENLDLYFCYTLKSKHDTTVYEKYESFLNHIDDKIYVIKNKLKKQKLKDDLLGDTPIYNSYTIDDIDNMSGREFEKYLFQLFEQMGYICTLTSESNDQGLDLIVEKYGKKIGIQAKCYKNKVGNTAVQEVLSGVQYYNCDEGMVITNSLFTSSADDLATKTGIVLWNRANLMEIMSQYPINKTKKATN
ncbi:hypothetical protein B5E87_04550 [Massilimicrobiota sp. An142]|uniref:restriction endonuclease n=1 Tax=Massilimicrobiota sp. An142 TaxID=1965564 RepID=UPI000B38BC46|nr:restriction endonuclease [Massilimicrobiota sp. An142]OUQ13852.1 hypothetical protein B5E87_04550 [Massilimicrobiota sp. An142]